MTDTAGWQDRLALTNPRFRRQGDYTAAISGRRARRLVEQAERRLEKQAKRRASK